MSIIFCLYLMAQIVVASPFVTTFARAFHGSQQFTSQGGHASCLSGVVSVFATATNTKLLLDEPASANQLSDYVQRYLQTNSDFPERIMGGPHNVSGTYDVNVKLCVPATGQASNSTIQVLTHGITLDSTYWDIASGFSYVDYAAENGYTTFSYDRLGAGNSSKPEPLQVLQAPLERELLHTLVTGLRSGSLGLGKYSKIVGVGHSYGSEVTNGLAGTYPSDLDAVLLTGFTANVTAFPLIISLFNPTPIALQFPQKFGNLPFSYFTPPAAAGEQVALLRYPNYNVQVANTAFETRQPASLGELFTQSVLFNPALGYRGPVALFNGLNDFLFCSGDCSYPTDQGAATIQQLYPNRQKQGSRLQLFDGIGHTINFHNEVGRVFEAMKAFLVDNGF